VVTYYFSGIAFRERGTPMLRSIDIDQVPILNPNVLVNVLGVCAVDQTIGHPYAIEVRANIVAKFCV
jgi:hypothetical protein